MNDLKFISDSNVTTLKTYNQDIMKAIAADIHQPPNNEFFMFGNMNDIIVFAGFGPEGEGIMFTGKSPEYIQSLLPRFIMVTFIHKRTNSFHYEAIRLSNRFPGESIICEYWITNRHEKRLAELTQVEYINGKHSVTETITNPEN
jgi:hypothetical protein